MGRDVKPPSNKQIEVVYKQVARKENKTEIKKIKSIKQVEHKDPKKLELLDKGLSEPSLFEKKLMDTSKFSEKVQLSKKYSPKMDPIGMHRTIKVPMLKSEKITNPRYLSYKQSVRQKIRERAYSHIDHPDFESGEVYLTFMISQKGKLLDIKVIDQFTKANEYLRNVGIRSIRESSPFPPFPKDLTYPELSFSIIITFELNE